MHENEDSFAYSFQFVFLCFTVLALINNHLIVSVLRGATN